MQLYNRSNNNFLGASLVANSGMMVACAPRAKSNMFDGTGSVTGACFAKDNRSDALTHIFDLPRTDNDDSWKYFRMMGHSISLTDKDELIIGAPLAIPEILAGVTNSRNIGHLLKFTKPSKKEGYLAQVRGADVSPWMSATLMEATKADPHKSDMVGTSFAVGRFFDDEDDGSSKRDVVVGAPKANRLMGRVYLCKDCFWGKNWKRPKDQKSIFIEGTQAGTRFGHSVCSVNLNGRGLDEVVVGAPLFSKKEISSYNQFPV